MSKFIDLTVERFNKLIAIKLVGRGIKALTTITKKGNIINE